MDKKELLYKANEAYRSGNPIMGDAEYDELEKAVGLENNNMIGEKHSPEMTIRHPFIMGSLSKIQVKADKDGIVDWDALLKGLRNYVGSKEVIVTPKYDGCSFEAYFKDGECVSISTRGDGTWGRDISQFIYKKIPSSYLSLNKEYTLRGEILVKKDVYEKKWKDEYANPRAFVAGVTGQDYDENDSVLLEKANDLSIVIYDYRIEMDGDGWYDENWTALPWTDVLPQYYIQQHIGLVSELEDIYNKFANFRECCEYALDGFVIKPVDRLQDFYNKRPKDCVAFKFMPMLAETTVERIEWSLGKTGEYFPIVYYAPVYMDGKKCVKASGHNYGTLVDKGIAPGAKIVISMAGDIIPYIYKVISPSQDSLFLPENTYVNDCHLMASMSEQALRIEEFRNSCKVLDVPGLGDELIAKMIDGIKKDCEPDEFFGDQGKEFPFSIFELESVAFTRHIGGRMGDKIAKAYKDIISTISLDTIIQTMNIRFCGKTLSKEIAKYLCGQPYDFGNMAQDGWKWVMDKDSTEYMKLVAILNMLGKDIQYYSTIAEQTALAEQQQGKKTYIIMTGEPNNYDTKQDFLNAHPEYENTTSWTKCQLVFTNSLESNTGKMKKAREKGITIKLY